MIMAEDGQVVRLQVANARPEDAGRGIARVSHKILAELGVQEGQPLEIIGKRHTTAIAIPPYAEDEGLDIVRLDGLQRVNAGIGSGDYVEIKKAEVRPATRVVLAPAQKNLRLQGSGEALRRTFYRRPLTAGDVISTSVHSPRSADPRFPEELRGLLNIPAYGLQEIRLVVVSTQPRGIVQVTAETEVELRPQFEEPKEARRADVTYDDIGGLGNTVDQVREMVELPLRHPELFQRLGIDPPKGVLLYGPPGTGKTLLARAVANETEAQFFHIAGPEIMGSHYGESEQRLRQVFQEARQNAPADHLHRRDRQHRAEARGGERRGGAAHRGAAPHPHGRPRAAPEHRRDRRHEPARGHRRSVAPSRPLRPGDRDRRPGRAGPPRGARPSTPAACRSREDVDLNEIARTTYGFVGADLSALAREAAMDSLRRILPNINLKDGIPADVLENLQVTRADFTEALKRVQPSALREIMIQVPNVTWDDIGGVDEARIRLQEGVELPLKSPESFRRIGIRPAKGFLLFGPPGTGKTLLAKAVARESQANFVATKSSDLLSKWYGEIRAAGLAPLRPRPAGGARPSSSSTKSTRLAPVRGGGLGEPAVTERVVNTILAEMDGLEELQGVVVMAATNRPNLVDPALLRPGRFDELIYVGVPDAKGRRHILGIHTKGMPLAEDVDLDDIARAHEPLHRRRPRGPHPPRRVAGAAREPRSRRPSPRRISSRPCGKRAPR